MVNKTTYLRSTKSYTAVSTQTRERKLSVGAIGLLTLILSNLDSYVIYKEVIQKRSGVGKTLFARFWKELLKNGFVYEIKSNKGRINYEYIIVNEPTNSKSIQALQNRGSFLIDGEQVTENQSLDIEDEIVCTNISLNNKDLSNVDLINEDLTNASLAIKENLNNIEELVEFWVENINNEILREEQLQILEDELFTSTLSNIVSNLKNNKNQILLIELKLPLIDIFDLYQFIVNDCKEKNETYTGFYLANEIISTISINQ